MRTFERIKTFGRNIVLNLIKWMVIFIIASIMVIDTVELVTLLVACMIDVLLLLILRNEMLKMVVNISSYWVLGPIAQLDLIKDFSTVSVLKVIFCFLVIVILQILEYNTYKDLVVE